jgi:hypothetical protein
MYNFVLMEITVNTIYGTFIVPREKTDQLLTWLQQNAIKAGQQPIRETNSDSQNFIGRELIHE